MTTSKDEIEETAHTDATTIEGKSVDVDATAIVKAPWEHEANLALINRPEYCAVRDPDGKVLFWNDDPISPEFRHKVKHEAERLHAFPAPLPISEEEWLEARSAPRCIVENYFYADVGVFIAPGGTGKTTLVLFEAIHIALGIDLFGHRVANEGIVVLLTAEDSREMLVARLRSIARQMDLRHAEMKRVRESVLISDVSGQGLKLTKVDRDVVQASTHVDKLISTLQRVKPVVIFIDPAVSFGVGESRVNDAEQGLVEAGRKMRNALTCAVIYIHHTGKQNARDKSGDQYAGRGGSAFADGSRMVQVLHSLEARDWLSATGEELAVGEVGLRLTRPKLSYSPAQPALYIARNGYSFRKVEAAESKDGLVRANADKVWKILNDEVIAGRFPSQRSIEAMDCGLTQRAVRDAIAWLRSESRVSEKPVASTGHGGKRSYLHPVSKPT